MGIDYDKQYADVPKKPKPEAKAEKPPLPATSVELTEATVTEYCQSLKPELLITLREIAADSEARPADRLAAAKELLDRGFGKTSSDAPAVVEKKDKSDVSERVLALLTDKQLEELRAASDDGE